MKKMNFLVAIATVCVCFLSGCGMRRQMYYPPYQQPTQPTTVQPELSTSDKKVAKRGTEAKVAEWESQGYTLTGAMSTFTMYDLLERHNNKLLSDEGRYVSVFGHGGDDNGELSVARMYALNDACTNYATAAGSVVSGGIGRQFSTFGEQGLKLMGAYTQKVAKYITPFMKESVAVKRTTQNNRLEVEVFYLIDEQRASTVRKQAMDEALRETATEQIFGTAVDEWVKEFVSDVE